MKTDEITQEQMADAIEELVGEMSAGSLLAIPGMWELLSEELNNAAIDHIMRAEHTEGAS